MILKIDMSGDIPIYVQLRNEIVKESEEENWRRVKICLQCGSLLQSLGSIR